MSVKSRMEKIAAWFQPKYDQIDKWELPWLQDLCRGLWAVMPKATRKALYTLITSICKKYGEDKAKEIMEEFKKIFDKLTA